MQLASPAFAAGGQTGNVSGAVTDTAKLPITDPTVTLASPISRLVTKTDARGFFDVPVDTYTISVQAKSVEPFSQTGITVFGDNTVDIGTLRLDRGLKTIGRITRRAASSAFTPNQTTPQFTVAGSQLEDTQGKKSNSSLSSALLAVPGFQTDSTGNLVLQGSLRDQIRYQIDGVDFSDQGFNGSVNNGFFKEIASLQVVPGAGDLSQANAGAGNLVVKQGSYPGQGLLDAEIGNHTFSHQLNTAYGTATSNNKARSISRSSENASTRTVPRRQARLNRVRSARAMRTPCMGSQPIPQLAGANGQADITTSVKSTGISN